MLPGASTINVQTIVRSRRLPSSLASAVSYAILHSETIKQTITTGALQVFLTTARRRVRSTPGCRVWHEIQNGSASIVMADQRAAFTIAGPVAAGRIFCQRRRQPIQFCTGKNIMSVRHVASAGYGIAVFGDRR